MYTNFNKIYILLLALCLLTFSLNFDSVLPIALISLYNIIWATNIWVYAEWEWELSGAHSKDQNIEPQHFMLNSSLERLEMARTCMFMFD